VDLSFTASFLLHLNASFASFNSASFLQSVATFINFPVNNVRRMALYQGSVYIEFSIWGSQAQVLAAEALILGALNGGSLGRALGYVILDGKVVQPTHLYTGSGSTQPPSSKKVISGGAVAGIVIGAIVLAVIIIAVAVLVVRKSSRNKYLLKEVDVPADEPQTGTALQRDNSYRMHDVNGLNDTRK